MGGYHTVVVGTDGSDSSLRAVERAAYLASGPDSQLVIATAYLPADEDARAADLLKDEGYKVTGNGPIYELLRDAKDRAKSAGATNIEERAVVGAPVDVLVDVAVEVGADLLVSGKCCPPIQDRCADRPHRRLSHRRRTSADAGPDATVG
jgi:nucleotide-binding universal stress UspA family protein